MLVKVKMYLRDCGFSIMKDFMKEDMDEREFVGMCSNICAAMYRVMNMETWDDLTDMISKDDLGVLGYISLQDLMDDCLPSNNNLTI